MGLCTLGCCLQAPLRFAPGLARACLRPHYKSRAPLLKMGHFDCDCLSFPPTLPALYARLRPISSAYRCFSSPAGRVDT
ncbi:hypothetical protein KC349_g148 [Hortaea werneckii]|nr:hypothetical protein KC349_g148 [Hortaea werneckii]